MKKLFYALIFLLPALMAQAQKVVIPAPAGSFRFASSITVLPNGNYVITDPQWQNSSQINVGAVYLYNGATNALISILTGSQANDQAGGNGIILLPNGNYIVNSPRWANGTATNAGAVTLCNATTGINGPITTANSLVGSQAGDLIGSDSVKVLPNGAYVVISTSWKNGTAANAGAVTWCNSTTGLIGPVSSSNSLVGSQTNDKVGTFGIVILPNGNYVVISSAWKAGSASQAGAVTWCNGTTGLTGLVSSSNSLVGVQTGDYAGSSGITILSNGNYVVKSEGWDNGSAVNAGAVTWCNGATGRTGPISSSNSLLGTNSYDGIENVLPLTNGNYVVYAPNWKYLSSGYAGAVTWGSGTAGISGFVSAANSLVGTKTNDQVGVDVKPLSNGNYVVNSAAWNNGTTIDVGAVTWGNGTTGTIGIVNSSNSLVGTKADDQVGRGGVIVLNNGNYVISSPYWDNGTVNRAGAATWANGTTGIMGFISAANSLVGSHTEDYVGDWYSGTSFPGITALNNGNYVVSSPRWDRGADWDVGAATWGNGTTGVSGAIDSNNSLTGSGAYSHISNGRVAALTNGNYVISSDLWYLSATLTGTSRGAVTWCNGATGRTGTVNSGNSLTGSSPDDRVGVFGAIALPNGNYVVQSVLWANTGVNDAGAVTWCNGATGTQGVVSDTNSLVGTHADDRVGDKLTILSNSNFVVAATNWDNGSGTDAGAVTLCSGTSKTTGIVSSSNSLVGTQPEDQVGNAGIFTTSEGGYIVASSNWKNGTLMHPWAFTPSRDTAAITGPVTSCNSAVGTMNNSNSYPNPYAVYNPIHNNIIATIKEQNRVVILRQFQSELAYGNSSAQQTFTGTDELPFIDTNCSLIAAVKPAGASPVRGLTKANLYVESSMPTTATGEGYCRRHYSILPAANANISTARITLYFTQADFIDFNSHNTTTPNLPSSPADAAGKKALRITQQRGTSLTGAFGSFMGWAGNGPVNVLINPGELNVVNNALLARWEVSFDATGFGGFFVSAGNEYPLSGPADFSRITGVTVSPIPAGNTITISNSNAALAGSTIIALNLQGQVMTTAKLETSTQMDIQNWPAGIYILKFVDDSVMKVVKQ